MPAPNIPNFFGANAELLTDSATVTATTTSPVLVIKQSDFADQGWDAFTVGDGIDPEKWVAAIVRKINAWSIANTDDVPNVVITAPILGLESRAETLKRRYSYSVDIYQPDTGSTEPDPDLV